MVWHIASVWTQARHSTHPDAANYDPTAKQSGKCEFRTRGCTSPTALNYNKEASIDDASCIEPVYGCTVAPDTYHEVDPNTPEWKSGWTGDSGDPGLDRRFRRPRAGRRNSGKTKKDRDLKPELNFIDQ